MKHNLGFALRQLQCGEEPNDYRSLSAHGKGLFELPDEDDDGWYRIVYLSRVQDRIHVLHIFSKKSREIPRNDVSAIERNLKQAQAWILEEKKITKREK